MMTAKRAIKKDTFFFLCLFALRGGFLPMMECRGGGKWGFGVAHGFEATNGYTFAVFYPYLAGQS